MSTATRARRMARFGYATVAERQAARHRDRMAHAGTAEEQAAAAWDWARQSIRHMPAAMRSGLLNKITRFLTEIALEAEHDRDRSRQIRDQGRRDQK